MELSPLLDETDDGFVSRSLCAPLCVVDRTKSCVHVMSVVVRCTGMEVGLGFLGRFFYLGILYEVCGGFG